MNISEIKNRVAGKLVLRILPAVFWALFAVKRLFKKKKVFGFLSEEFFAESFLKDKLCDIGGFGMTAKVITQYYGDRQNKAFRSAALFNRTLSGLPGWKFPIGDSLVYTIPDLHSHYARNHVKYCWDANKQFDFLLSIDLYPGYEFSLDAMPKAPLLIWLRDPKGETELEKIATVETELPANNMTSIDEFLGYAREERQFFAKVYKDSQATGRPIMFVTNAHFLTPRGQRLYGPREFNPHFLPNPIHYLPLERLKKADRPTVTLLGRLDPVKRPWVYFELAKRFAQVEFLVCGNSSYPEIINPIIEKYRSVENLKFLGLVQGEQKERVLTQSWVLVNTSIHEGLPCSFLEALSCHTPILSSVDPDNLVSKFGTYTGDNLGDGMDETTLGQFQSALEEMLSDRNRLEERGAEARKYIEGIYSFEAFEQKLKGILDAGFTPNFKM